MIRSWGKVTLNGSAQPWFPDVTTAAIGLPDGAGIIKVTVASTTKYRNGDRILVSPGAADVDTLMVDTIASSTVLNCKSEGNAPTHTHVTSTVIRLAIACADVMFQVLPGNAQAVWLGSDNTVTNVGGGSAFLQMQDVAPNAVPTDWRLSNNPQWNAHRTTDGWMAGKKR